MRLVAETSGCAILEFMRIATTLQFKRNQIALVALAQPCPDELHIGIRHLDGSTTCLLIGGCVQQDHKITRLDLRDFLHDIRARVE